MDRIDYIELPSKNRELTGAFLQAAFGWGLIDFGPDYGGVTGAGIDVGIDQAEARVAMPLAIIRTHDLDDAERRVRAAGGQITRNQFDFPGGRRFHFRAPGGVELAVWSERADD